MALSTTLRAFRRSFHRRGTFTLLPDQSINAAVRQYDVPRAPGVYVIAEGPEQATVFYIGCAGTGSSSGEWMAQGLRGRLVNLQGGERRPVVFRRFLVERGLPRLFFEWFVTLDTIREVAGFLKVRKRTIYPLAAAKKIPARGRPVVA